MGNGEGGNGGAPRLCVRFVFSVCAFQAASNIVHGGPHDPARPIRRDALRRAPSGGGVGRVVVFWCFLYKRRISPSPCLKDCSGSFKDYMEIYGL